MLKHRRQFEAEHRQLLAAITARNASRAVSLLTEHLEGASDRLIAELGDDPGLAVSKRTTTLDDRTVTADD
jgi:DNA-binding GntR family transcriptional regulator